MPGIAQVWLTQKEIEALLISAPSMGKRVPDHLWPQIEAKLVPARDSLGCPVPWAELAFGDGMEQTVEQGPEASEEELDEFVQRQLRKVDL